MGREQPFYLNRKPDSGSLRSQLGAPSSLATATARYRGRGGSLARSIAVADLGEVAGGFAGRGEIGASGSPIALAALARGLRCRIG